MLLSMFISMCVHVSILLCAFFSFFLGCLIHCHVQFVACTFVTCCNKDQSINQPVGCRVELSSDCSNLTNPNLHTVPFNLNEAWSDSRKSTVVSKLLANESIFLTGRGVHWIVSAQAKAFEHANFANLNKWSLVSSGNGRCGKVQTILHV